MKLTSLSLTNFRCFQDVAIDLNVDGVIGVLGPNGAGKSSLFAAVDWALFGSERGPSSLPAHRDGTDPKSCRVQVEFLLGEQRFRVTRTPSSAELRLLDSDTRMAKGLTDTSAQVAVTLGMSRESFQSTFYARQREVQALDPRDAPRRRSQLERLLGIERIRHAAELARAQSREQELLVKARSADAADPKQELARLREAEDLARQRAPAVEQAREALSQVTERREQARKALQSIHRRAARAQKAESEAKLAAADADSALKDAERAGTAAREAQQAHARAGEIAPAAARAEELRARDRELELRRQGAEQAQAIRARWQAAQSNATALQERLGELADERGELERLQAELHTTNKTAQDASTRSVEMIKELARLEAREREAQRALTDAARLLELTALLAEKPDVEAQAQQAARTLTDVQAQILEVQRHAAEEQSNRQEIERDGPEAQCLRCRRPYGEDFQRILDGIAGHVQQLTSSLVALERTVNEARTARVAADNRLAELAALRREYDALIVTGDLDSLREAAETLASRRSTLSGEHETLEASRTQAEERASTLQAQIEPIAARVNAWQTLDQEHRSAARDAELLAGEMTSTPAQDYDSDTHAQVRAELAEAQSAERELASVHALAGQLEVLTARAAQAATRAQQAKDKHERAHTEAQALSIDEEAVSTAADEDLAAEEARTAATDELHTAEQQAIREDDAVKAAREALQRARQSARQLRAERQELTTRKRVQELLEDYRSHRSQHALPDLERDTAALLAAVTRGRYSDIHISADGYALQISEEGTSHPLKRFSGGEQDITNLCLRLALSRILARERGTDAGFVILDEVLGSQDPDRRTALMEELRELTGEFQQVFVVSHFTDIADSCDIHLNVSRPDPPAPASVTPG